MATSKITSLININYDRLIQRFIKDNYPEYVQKAFVAKNNLLKFLNYTYVCDDSSIDIDCQDKSKVSLFYLTQVLPRLYYLSDDAYEKWNRLLLKLYFWPICTIVKHTMVKKYGADILGEFVKRFKEYAMCKNPWSNKTRQIFNYQMAESITSIDEIFNAVFHAPNITIASLIHIYINILAPSYQDDDWECWSAEDEFWDDFSCKMRDIDIFNMPLQEFRVHNIKGKTYLKAFYPKISYKDI